MKRKLSCLLLTIAAVLVTAVPGLASDSDAKLNHVTDQAGILTESEAEELEEKAQTISDSYDCGVYIVTLDDFTSYTSETDAYEAAKEIFTEYDLGYGSDDDGIILLLSMEDRDYGLAAHGTIGNGAFTDYGKEVMEDNFLTYFRYDEWSDGFDSYLSDAEEYLQLYEEGTPYDYGSSSYYESYEYTSTSFADRVRIFFITMNWVRMMILLLVPAVVALILCSIWKAQMRSVAMKNAAGAYVNEDHVKLLREEDRYTHTTVERVRVEEDHDHGGTTVDSDGFSGGSGKF